MWRSTAYPINSKQSRQLCILASVAVWLVLAASAAWGGTIKGTVKFAGGATAQKKVLVTIDQYICGKEKDAEDLVLSLDRGIRNAVVSVQNPPPGLKWEESGSTILMDQKQCAFVPRIVVVPVGGSVQFLNSDRLMHNVKSVGKENPSFNRAQPHARTITVTFKSPEILRVDCDLHSWMRGWVVVAEHPLYAVTNERGEFMLENVPAGKYTLQVWQESLGTVTTAVTVGGKDTTSVTVEMGKK